MAALVLGGCGSGGVAEREGPRAAGFVPASERLPFTGGGDGDGKVRPAGRAVASAADRSVGLTALMTRRVLLRTRPMGRVVTSLGRRTVFGGRQYLAVVDRRGRWVAVLHHAMPNGQAGWVPLDAVRLYSSPWSISVDLSERLARLRVRGKVVHRFPVGIGRPSNPTPTGRFAITDRLLAGPGLPYGCCVLALSGRQLRLPAGWPGGDRLAFHGVADESRVGRATSYGCLHVRARDLRRLIRRVRAGTRVTISA